MTVTIEGGGKLQAFLDKFKFQKARVDAGFFPEAKYKDGTQVAQVAIWLEDGTEKNGKEFILPRPFLLPTFNEQKEKWKKKFFDIIQNQNEIDVKKALFAVGRLAQDDIRDKIDWWAESGTPRNAEATIKIKSGERYGEKEESGRSVGDSPLIWSGHMRDSVAFKVTEK